MNTTTNEDTTPEPQNKPARVSIIREDLAKLLKHPIKAQILGQFLYWQQHNRSLKDGWIYKTADELCEELMLDDWLTASTIRRYLKSIVDKGYLFRRTNPLYKWDKTFQYYPNIEKIREDLSKIGYKFAYNNDKVLSFANAQFAQSNPHIAQSNAHIAQSNPHSARAIPKTTPETTSEITEQCRNLNQVESQNQELDITIFQFAKEKEIEFLNALRQIQHPAQVIEAAKTAYQKGRVKNIALYLGKLINLDRVNKFRTDLNQTPQAIPDITTRPPTTQPNTPTRPPINRENVAYISQVLRDTIKTSPQQEEKKPPIPENEWTQTASQCLTAYTKQIAINEFNFIKREGSQWFIRLKGKDISGLYSNPERIRNIETAFSNHLNTECKIIVLRD